MALTATACLPPAPAAGPKATITHCPVEGFTYGNGFGLATDQTGSGAKNIVAAFILATGNTCTPAWDGDSGNGITSARSTTIASDMAKVRANGGDALISFGGQSGTELAIGCTNTANLTTAYRSVIDKFGLTKIDFDVEGSGLSNV